MSWVLLTLLHIFWSVTGGDVPSDRPLKCRDVLSPKGLEEYPWIRQPLHPAPPPSPLPLTCFFFFINSNAKSESLKILKPFLRWTVDMSAKAPYSAVLKLKIGAIFFGLNLYCGLDFIITDKYNSPAELPWWWWLLSANVPHHVRTSARVSLLFLAHKIYLNDDTFLPYIPQYKSKKKKEKKGKKKAHHW